MNEPKRIFWLGMHKILTATELPRLRMLGYEVFNPPYISDVYDQSANLEWNSLQPTTLPPEVFEQLSKYKFFYNQISPEIAELLNAYFDAVIVTINPQWLAAVVRVFHRKIVYRTYGQTYQICAHLIGDKVWKRILENPDFHFVPFAEETLIGEQQWLLDRCSVVPYSLPQDVYTYEATWSKSLHSEEIMVSVPNINHPYYRSMYEHLNHNFPGRYIRMYGVQAGNINDLRVAGTLPRADVLHAYQRARGYFYPYHDSHVCYLPPIEMMTIGGPVVYVEKSLISRMFKRKTPGLARGLAQHTQAIERLRRGDRVYVNEILSSQDDIVHRYHPDYVYPVFDKTMTSLLGDACAEKKGFSFSGSILSVQGSQSGEKEAWLLCHWPGQLIHEHVPTGTMYAADGISRVLLRVIEALLNDTDYIVVLSCYAYQAPIVSSFYLEALKDGRIRLYVLDPENLENTGSAASINWGSIFDFLIRHQVPAASPEEGRLAATGGQLAGRMKLVLEINQRPQVASVFVPHYYHFPEALNITKPLVAYIPDYMPHFYPGVAFEGSLERDNENTVVGGQLTAKAAVVMTNSQFTRKYLPSSALNVAAEKIRTIPMPLLSAPLISISADDRMDLESLLNARPFLVYPTANRPNKELAFLLNVFKELKQENPDLRLVLTCRLTDHKPVEETALALGLVFEGDVAARDIVLFPGAQEGILRWLYENAQALVLTSSMEGNFPPQIIEALHYDTPVVATRLPHIEEALADAAEHLLLCSPKSLSDFVFQTKLVFRNRQFIVHRQSRAKRNLVLWNNLHRFSRMAANLFREADASGVRPEPEEEPSLYDDSILPFGLLARIKKVLLSEATSDRAFSLAVHDLVLRKRPDDAMVAQHVRTLQAGRDRRAVLAELLKSSNDSFFWNDSAEVQFALKWLNTTASQISTMLGTATEIRPHP